MQNNDPFVNDDPRWEPYDPSQNNSEFSQADVTPTTIKGYLRSETGQREFERLIPPQPAPEPQPQSIRVIPHIWGYPN